MDAMVYGAYSKIARVKVSLGNITLSIGDYEDKQRPCVILSPAAAKVLAAALVEAAREKVSK